MEQSRVGGRNYRVNFDLIINSFGKGYSNIIVFKGNGARNDKGNTRVVTYDTLEREDRERIERG